MGGSAVPLASSEGPRKGAAWKRSVSEEEFLRTGVSLKTSVFEHVFRDARNRGVSKQDQLRRGAALETGVFGEESLRKGAFSRSCGGERIDASKGRSGRASRSRRRVRAPWPLTLLPQPPAAPPIFLSLSLSLVLSLSLLLPLPPSPAPSFTASPSPPPSPFSLHDARDYVCTV